MDQGVISYLLQIKNKAANIERKTLTTTTPPLPPDFRGGALIAMAAPLIVISPANPARGGKTHLEKSGCPTNQMTSRKNPRTARRLAVRISFSIFESSSDRCDILTAITLRISWLKICSNFKPSKHQWVHFVLKSRDFLVIKHG